MYFLSNMVLTLRPTTSVVPSRKGVKDSMVEKREILSID